MSGVMDPIQKNPAVLPSWRFPQGAGFANLFDPAKAAQVNRCWAWKRRGLVGLFHAGVGVVFMAFWYQFYY